ncbi:MAG TPA: PDZ domain-containing protein [bacterium]|nr:PDZ domain-containing protein [bacterium]HPT30157.1 PDZ domain-containing protein [bacterium]
MTKNKSQYLIVIIAILFFSLLGGLLGSWLLKGQTDLTPAIDEINLDDSLNSQARVLIRDPRKVVVNQDLKIQEIVLSSQESSLYFFRQKAVDKTEKGIDVSAAYNLSQPDFFGLVLTSDGWVLMPRPEGFNSKTLVGNYQAVSRTKKIYNIDKAVDYPDGRFSLVHVAGVNNLLPKNLLSASDSQVGQTVLAINAAGDAWLSYVASWRPADGISRSSDSLNWQANLMDEVPVSFRNSWLFSMSGDLLALIDVHGKLLPTMNFRTPVASYFKKQTFSRPYLGVNYWDLSSLVKNEGAGKESSLNLSGALLLPEGKEAAVIKGSPAQQAGLLANDIITSVSGTELNAGSDLAAIIQGYKAGDEVTLKYWRQGEVKEVDIILGEQK